jgi:hypothetical protein
MNKKRYLAVTGTGRRDELYLVTKSVENKFEKLFGKFDDFWKDHEGAVDWLRKNAKFVNSCTCVSV